MKRKNSFWEELKRRNVVKGAISYIVVAWLLIRITSLLGGILEMPLWISKSLFFLLLGCFPIWLLLSWVYEATSDGIKRTSKVDETASIRKKTNKRLNKLIIGLLSMALVVLVVDRFNISAKTNLTKNNNSFSLNADNTIAVLPFMDYSQKQENEYFADGLTEELLNLLSQVEELKVTSRTSTFSFKNSGLDIPTIAKKLNVTFVLEGSVRKSKNQLRITAQLIEAHTDKHLWSETYDRTMDNVFAIQDEVAVAVVKALKINLLEGTSVPKTIKTNSEAYNYYLQAKAAEHFSSDVLQIEKAVTFAKKALDIDPNYIPALLLLSKLYENQANNMSLTFDEGYSLAKGAANKVLEINSSNGLAYAYLADYELCYDWNFKKAKQLNANALELDPNNPQIIDLAANLAIAMGNINSAVRLQEYSLSLDPLNPETHYNLSNIYYYADRLEEAEKEAKKCIELQPDRFSIHYYHTRILLQQGKIAQAQEAIKFEKDEGWRLQMFTDIYYKLGDFDKSEDYMQELINKYQNEMAYQIAESYSFRNDIENAFLWLNNAYKVHDVGLNEILAEPRFRNLHSDKRWDRFIKKMGFPEQKT